MFGRMKDPVAGQAMVVAVENVLPTANPVTFQGKLVVSADGVPKTTVEHKERYWRKGRESITLIWPNAGDVVPVIVDRADATRLRLDWDQIRERVQAAGDKAQHDQEQRKDEGEFDRRHAIPAACETPQQRQRQAQGHLRATPHRPDGEKP